MSLQSRHNSYVLTVTGRRVCLLDPKPCMFTITDIAHALSMIPRFNGNLPQFYSVASHSYLVSKLVSPAVRLAALLHDASEAYLCDIPSPLKALLPTYKVIEARFQATIHEAFGLPPHLPAQWLAEIQRADLQMLAAEKAMLMMHDDGHWPVLDGVEPIPSCFGDLKAYTGVGDVPYRLFLDAFSEYPLEVSVA